MAANELSERVSTPVMLGWMRAYIVIASVAIAAAVVVLIQKAVS